MSRHHFRGGWSLTVEHEWTDITLMGSLSVTRYPAGIRSIRLDGLCVTPGQAQALIHARDRGCPSLSVRDSYHLGAAGHLVLSGIELTMEEARLIQQGANPVDVLLPPLLVRVLEEPELTGEGRGCMTT